MSSFDSGASNHDGSSRLYLNHNGFNQVTLDTSKTTLGRIDM